eukprot:3189060-Rhodomonas_salina.1
MASWRPRHAASRRGSAVHVTLTVGLRVTATDPRRESSQSRSTWPRDAQSQGQRAGAGVPVTRTRVRRSR